MEKERRIVCWSRNVEWVSAKEGIVLTARCDGFELRPFGKAWREDRYEFHLPRNLVDAVDFLRGKWTLRNKDRCHAVLADLRTILFANNHDVLTRISNAKVHQ